MRTSRLLPAVLTLVVSTAGCGGGGSSSAPPPPAPQPGGPIGIGSVTPTQGPDTGGTALTVAGAGFVTGGAVDEVRVGGAVAGNLQVLSDTQLVVTTPSGSGAADVQVRRTWTGNVATETGAFQYLSGAAPAPTLLSVVPGQGPDTGGTPITINGSGFQTGATASVGGGAITNVIVHGASRLSGTLPSGTVGPATVIVTNPDLQSGTINGGFSYVTTPTISSVYPTTSWTTGGTIVTVSGSDFAPGVQVYVGNTALTSVTFVNSNQVTGVTGVHTAGTVTVTVLNIGLLQASLPNAFTYVTTADTQTAAYTWDTASGIDCRRRWYVNCNHASFLKDLQNQGLQTWGTAGDNSAPPTNLPLVDALVRDWVRAYTLSALNVMFGRTATGGGVSGTSCNITFVGLPPTTGARGCASPSTDWGEICVGGCDPSSGTGHPIANQVCGIGLLGASRFDYAGATTCGTQAEHSCNSYYHGCTGCSWPSSAYGANGVFSGVIGTQWIASMSGGPLAASDHAYLDGSITTGTRYNDVHSFMQQFAYRIAYVLAHEIGHSSGLVATSTTGTCTSSSGLCSGGAQHNSCCTTNIMNGSGSLWGTFTPTSRAFSGQPSSVSAASTCYTSGVSSWALLQAFLGTTP